MNLAKSTSKYASKTDERNRKENFQCQLCGESLASQGSLKNHIDAVHKQIKPFQYEECSKFFSQKISLYRHQGAIHKGIKPF